MITIELNDLEFYAYHGVYDEEKEKGNTFIVNLEVTGEFDEAIKKDELTGTIDYEELDEPTTFRLTFPCSPAPPAPFSP